MPGSTPTVKASRAGPWYSIFLKASQVVNCKLQRIEQGWTEVSSGDQNTCSTGLCRVTNQVREFLAHRLLVLNLGDLDKPR